MKYFLLFTFLLANSWAFGQLKVDTFQSVNHLVNKVLLGEGVNATNIKYTGPKGGMGLFVNDSTKLQFGKGILLTSSNVYRALGPNKSPSMSTSFASKGDKALTKIAKGTTWDAAILEFDFVPVTNNISFQFIFGSEEYTEFVGSPFNDVFAFFVSGPGIPGEKNIATLPDGETTVTINNINPSRNSEFYVDNNLWDDHNMPIQGKRKLLQTQAAPYSIEYDGLTTPLTAQIQLQPGQKYHIRIAIADVGDPGLDSGVFLEAGSFKSKPLANLTTNLTSETPEQVAVSTTVPEPLEIPDTKPQRLLIHFDSDSYALNTKGRQEVQKAFTFLQNHPDEGILLCGHTDSKGSNNYNNNLGRKRAETVKRALIKLGLQSERFEIKSKSEDQPVESNQAAIGRAANRRVEVQIMVH